ncbi:MAG: ribonuclease R [Pseudomonadota bacterium]
MPSSKPRRSGLPTRAEILDYLKRETGKNARRDLARAFGVKGSDRTALRMLLKDMEAAGELERTGPKRVGVAGTVPPVAPVDVVSVNDDGDLGADFVAWRGDGAPPSVTIPAREAARRKPPVGVGDRVLARLRKSDAGLRAEIIKTIGKGASQFLAVYRRRGKTGVLEPADKKNRQVFIVEREDARDARDGDLVWADAKNTRGYGARKARVRRKEAHVDDDGAFSLIALASHGVPITFPEEVEQEARAARAPGLEDREDWRQIPLLTIDPADAKDHDDAVWACPDEDPDNAGGFKVVVAIADVSHFVRPESALDAEARRRGNSTYLPDRVVPMLPEALSNGLCSLRVGEDRSCLGVEMTLTAKGRKRAHRFFRAVMRSAAKLSYEDAQAIIEGGDHPEADVAASVRHLHAAYKARMLEREKRAPLDLELPERRVVLGKKGGVEKIVVRERFDAHRLIEEFMILANVAAAEALEAKRRPLIYRVHDQPADDRLDALRDYLDTMDYALVKGAVKPIHFNRLLAKAEERDQKEMISDVVLRAQRQAVYATENLGHFGLNLGRYAHFTSPIRRYADLTVHRALIAAEKLGPGGQTAQEADALEKIAEAISDLERRSMAAERDATDRYMASFLSGRVGAEFDGRIRGVTRAGLFVALDETGADGFAPISTLGAERFRYEEDAQALIGEETGGRYAMGARVRVRLLEATPLTGGLRFDVLTEPAPGAKPKRSGGARTPGFRRVPRRGGAGGKQRRR